MYACLYIHIYTNIYIYIYLSIYLFMIYVCVSKYGLTAGLPKTGMVLPSKGPLQGCPEPTGFTIPSSSAAIHRTIFGVVPGLPKHQVDVRVCGILV